ncbi:MAG TPA: hypothetical protein VFM18_21495 [Methanosarcina sp.]|nr:hypothetical protein [Methanosarcina sp.]
MKEKLVIPYTIILGKWTLRENGATNRKGGVNKNNEIKNEEINRKKPGVKKNNGRMRRENL